MRAVLRIRVRDSGSAVWTVRNPYTDPIKRQVYAWERGKLRTLDPGPDVDTGSLKLRGNRASWISAGRRREATIR